MYSLEEKDAFRQNFKARIYSWTVRLVKYLRVLANKQEGIARSVVDQLIRSGTSVGANYIEAIASPTTKDFCNFLSHSLKSGNESKYWLCLIRDTGIDNTKELGLLLQEATEICNILGKSISTMKNK